MIRLIFLAFILASNLFANTAVTENDPSTLVNGVSVITGDLFTYEEDYRVQGLEPISLRRGYLSSVGNWNLYPHLTATFFIDAEQFIISEANGTSISYFLRDKIRKKDRDQNKWPKSIRFDAAWNQLPGVTNTASGTISAHTNYKNQYLIASSEDNSFILYAANGTKRTYRLNIHQDKVDTGLGSKHYVVLRYSLHTEDLPSGHSIQYHWNDDQLSSISICTRRGSTLASVSQALSSDTNQFFGSDGRSLCYTKGDLDYKGKKEKVWKYIDSPEAPHQNLDRIVQRSKRTGVKKHYLKSITLPQGRSILVGYEKVGSLHYRVNRLLTQAGQVINGFGYWKGETRVTDAHNNLTVYRYNRNDQRLTTIETHEGYCHQLHHSERFVWDGMHIRCKAYLNSQGQPEYARTFAYDERGNVREETFWGNLSGNGQPLQLDHQGMPIDNGVERCSKRTEYTDDGRNLPKKQEDSNGCVTQIEYIPDTHLVKSKVVCDRKEAKIHYDYEYNDECILIREIINDGITQTIRDIQPRKEKTYYGLPHSIEEKYHDGKQEVLVRKTEFGYGTGALVEKKSIFDAQRKHCYDLAFRHDRKGNLVSETNGFGWESKAQYDELGNKTYEQDVCGNVSLFHYDVSNRLISKETTGFDGIRRNFAYEYNALNHLILEQDHNGHRTRYVTNPFGHRIETTRPDGSVLRSQFDSLGREIKTTDADGFVTQTRYNAYGKPIWIQHPDGSEEKKSYFLDGSLQSTIDAAGVETKYTRDYLGRVTLKTIEQHGQVLAQEMYTYTGQLLTSTTDAEGYITEIFYDRGGRKIAEKRNGEQIGYEYDSMGRVHAVEKKGIRTVTKYDWLDRVLEESEEEIKTHQTVRCVRYAYDKAGNKTDVWRWIANEETREQFVYDSHNRLIRTIDPMGAERKIVYEDSFYNEQGERVLRKTDIDAMGLQTIETFNAMGQIFKVEKQNSKLYLQTYKNYNGRGYLIGQTDRIFSPDGGSRNINTQWDYDSCGRLARLIEAAGTAEAKITEHTYTLRGEKATTKKPDGVTLLYEYNGLGANTCIRSSDGTVNHTLVYNRLGQLVQQDGITRELDAHGRTLVEIFPHCRIESKYNGQGQRIECRLPQSDCSIEYDYFGRDLRAISRKTLHGMEVYTHRYVQRDLAGNLLQSERLDGLPITYSYDFCARQQSIQTDQYQQQVLSSDRVGNLLQLKTLNDESTFTYDELYQITSERGLFNHNYTLDSLHCRLQKDNESYQVNSLNQLVSHIEYDRNGNPRRKGDTLYTFDALDRLIQIQTPAGIEKYTYDALHRRIRAENREGVRYFLYDGQNEIGSLNEKLELQELRILAFTPHAEIGSAIGIELKGQAYIPIHDLSGNIAALVPLHGGDPEITRYNAYGEELGSKLSPWRFSSKRTDITGLVYFGRRYYQPELGRWLSPDPAGFTDGMNLYAFVHNNPLIHFDEYGLFANYGDWETDPAKSRRFDVAAIHEIGCQALGIGRFVASVPYYLERGFNYCSGRESSLLAHWQKTQNNFFDKLENSIYRVFSTDRTHPDYLSYRNNIELASYVAGGLKILQGAFFKFGPKVATFASGVWSCKRSIGGNLTESALFHIEPASTANLLHKRGSEFIKGSNGVLGRKGFELKNASYQKIRNKPMTIHNRFYGGHALDQMQNRGFFPSVVENTINKGQIFPTKPGTIGYYDSTNNVRVIINSNNGKVVTVIPGAPK